MILRRNVSLAVGESVQFAFLYGYVTPGAPKSLQTLLADYAYSETRGNGLMVLNGQVGSAWPCRGWQGQPYARPMLPYRYRISSIVAYHAYHRSPYLICPRFAYVWPI
jgi:hypothetical protein